MSLDAVLARIDADQPAALERLFAFLRIPSISTDPAFTPQVAEAANWLCEDLQSLGFEASIRPTPGHPMVVAHADGDGPHVLFYGHYDVQPVDPLDLWNRDPFDPALEDTPHGKVIRARGAGDDKGQLMTFLEACRAFRAETGRLPCKITAFFEGEEESSSPSLVPFLNENTAELTADLALICDTGLYADGVPAIVTQLRGMMGVELTITGPSLDLHSGLYGGIARNPARVLTRILGEMHDDQGRIQVPGFYDDVAEITPELKAQWEALGFDEAAFLGAVGLSEPAGETGRSGLEMMWSRPTAEINGIWSGYTGAGFKTVLPSKASAKVSFRLVSKQDPDKIRASFEQWVTARLPADCSVSFIKHSNAPASQMDISHPAFELARQALSDEWPGEAAFVGGGGSIPVAGYFKDILGMDSMLIGFGKDDDAIHSPNEKYDLESFHRGARSWARILSALSTTS